MLNRYRSCLTVHHYIAIRTLGNPFSGADTRFLSMNEVEQAEIVPWYSLGPLRKSHQWNVVAKNP